MEFRIFKECMVMGKIFLFVLACKATDSIKENEKINELELTDHTCDFTYLEPIMPDLVPFMKKFASDNTQNSDRNELSSVNIYYSLITKSLHAMIEKVIDFKKVCTGGKYMRISAFDDLQSLNLFISAMKGEYIYSTDGLTYEWASSAIGYSHKFTSGGLKLIDSGHKFILFSQSVASADDVNIIWNFYQNVKENMSFQKKYIVLSITLDDFTGYAIRKYEKAKVFSELFIRIPPDHLFNPTVLTKGIFENNLAREAKNYFYNINFDINTYEVKFNTPTLHISVKPIIFAKRWNAIKLHISNKFKGNYFEMVFDFNRTNQISITFNRENVEWKNDLLDKLFSFLQKLNEDPFLIFTIHDL